MDEHEHEPDEDRLEARRRHNRLIDELDREIAESKQLPEETPVPPRRVVQIPAHPNFGRIAGRYGQAAEELWIDRMKAKYGGEP
jgi:hypothetical protein